MKDLNIRSLGQLKRRKRAIRRQTREFEYEFEENIYNFTHPFSSPRLAEMLENDLDSSHNSGIAKIIVNGRRLVEIVRLGTNIFKDFKK